jgi:hypothetical protein
MSSEVERTTVATLVLTQKQRIVPNSGGATALSKKLNTHKLFSGENDGGAVLGEKTKYSQAL